MKLSITLLAIALFFGTAVAERSFVIVGDNFVKDGKIFRVISGAFHYFRVPRVNWRDRLLKMKAGGLNTVETYVAWNLHEPVRGKISFDGELDIAEFLRTAAEVGLLAIVRPPPFICAEWEFGGMPSWLIEDGPVELRCSDPKFLSAADAFLRRLASEIEPLQYHRGGPLVMVQIENEYGSYGSDKSYLQHLADTLRSSGISVQLFCSNGPDDRSLRNGVPDDPTILRTANFGCTLFTKAYMKILRKYQPTGPLFCTELWDGWFDAWGGGPHHKVAADAVEFTLRELLEMNASVNLYMYVGGTNFGFTAGANFNANTQAPENDVTSYDYDSPISESGDLTTKWQVIRNLIAKFEPVSPDPPPPPQPKAAYGKVSVALVNGLLNDTVLSFLSKPTVSPMPKSFASLHQSFGFVLYEATVSGPFTDVELSVIGLRDRASVFIDGKFAGNLMCGKEYPKIKITTPNKKAVIQLLVENLGRVNFGPHLPTEADKGIVAGGVTVDLIYVHGWKSWPLPFSGVPDVPPGSTIGQHQPGFYRGHFSIGGTPEDTFVDTQGWVKGVIWVNGHNLGRYWNIGPQRTLFLPAPFLKSGMNIIDVFELDTPHATVDLIATPILG